jgi:hypothetical protein
MKFAPQLLKFVRQLLKVAPQLVKFALEFPDLTRQFLKFAPEPPLLEIASDGMYLYCNIDT